QYDQLNVLGSANLDGVLNISLINGFGPRFGQSFEIMKFAAATGNFANVGGVKPDTFKVNLNSTVLTLIAGGNASDLAFASMSIPSTATPGQSVSVSYMANNLENMPATGDWYDSLYVSSSPVMDTSAQLLGRVHHVGD